MKKMQDAIYENKTCFPNNAMLLKGCSVIVTKKTKIIQKMLRINGGVFALMAH